jgi:hypothetical protein
VVNAKPLQKKAQGVKEKPKRGVTIAGSMDKGGESNTPLEVEVVRKQY